MKKILILYTKAPSEVFNRKSALGSYINCLANLLHREHTEVYLNGVHLDKVPESSSNRNISTPASSVIKKFVPSYLKKVFREKAIFKTADQLTQEILDGGVKFDHVLEFYTLGSQGGITISKQMKCPLSIIYDGPIIEEYEFFQSGRPVLEMEISRREKQSLCHASNIVVYSEPMKRYVLERAGTTANMAIHQNIDFTRFESYEERTFTNIDTINICFIGSFLKWHDVDFLVHGFSQLIREGLNVKLYLVGQGQEHSKIVDLVEAKDIAEHVEITGFLDGNELFELKKKMSIGVMPGSNWYGAPNKIFEYGAMKMAVLAPKTPTIDYLFNENEVQFFEWKNQKDLTNKLRELCKTQIIEEKAMTLFDKIRFSYSEEKTENFYVELISLN